MESEIDIKAVIARLGGPSKAASLCGMETSQSVSMWVARKKIPQARLQFLRLARPDVFAPVGAGDTPSVPTGTETESAAA
jgi:hypothetical protein